MIWLLILIGYMAGWFPAAVVGTRLMMGKAHCHSEPQFGSAYRWGYGDCKRFDKPECWRVDNEPTLRSVCIGCAAAFAWPLAAIAGGVYLAAKQTKPKSVPRVLSERELAQLEVQAGIKPRGVEGIDYNTPFDRQYYR